MTKQEAYNFLITLKRRLASKENYLSRVDPCEGLWGSVVRDAINDFLIYRIIDETEESAAQKKYHYRHAVAFLTSESGEWAESRNLVCEAGLIDPDKLKKVAQAFLASNDSFKKNKVQYAKRKRAYAYTYHQWNEKSEQFLRDNFGKIPTEEIAKIYKKTFKAVILKAKKMGLV